MMLIKSLELGDDRTFGEMLWSYPFVVRYWITSRMHSLRYPLRTSKVVRPCQKKGDRWINEGRGNRELTGRRWVEGRPSPQSDLGSKTGG